MKDYKNIKPIFEIASGFKSEVTAIGHEHVGIISERSDGWKKEVNIVAWNGGIPKFDIRDWDPNHEKMSRGITLLEDEAQALCMALNNYFIRG